MWVGRLMIRPPAHDPTPPPPPPLTGPVHPRSIDRSITSMGRGRSVQAGVASKQRTKERSSKQAIIPYAGLDLPRFAWGCCLVDPLSPKQPTAIKGLPR